MPSLTVTEGSPDRRLARPQDLFLRDESMSTAQARDFIDRASARAMSSDGLGFAPWRQTYNQVLYGTGTGFLKSHAKPLESVEKLENFSGSEFTDFRFGSNGSGILDRLERDGGFHRNFGAFLGTSLTIWDDSEKDAWIMNGATMGWIMPGQISTWAATTAYVATIATTSYDDAFGAVYAVGSWVRSFNPAVELLYEATTGGTSGASEPSEFQTAIVGDAIADGTVIWTARASFQLPADIEEGALLLALALYQDRTESTAVKSERDGQGAVTYEPGVARERVMELWSPYR